MSWDEMKKCLQSAKCNVLMHFSTNFAPIARHPRKLCACGLLKKIAPSPCGLVRDHNPMPAEVVSKGVLT